MAELCHPRRGPSETKMRGQDGLCDPLPLLQPTVTDNTQTPEVTEQEIGAGVGRNLYRDTGPKIEDAEDDL